MKWKITLVVAIVAGAIGGSWLKNLPGFIIIAYDKTSYEMRLWVAVALLLLLISGIVLLFVFARWLINGANKVKGWQGDRQWRKARKQTINGMLAFIEGRWKQAEKTMIGAAKNSDTELINYLVAAQSAQHQNAEDRRDSYLRLAHKIAPNAKVAIGLTQAQLQLDNLQYERALATLADLRIKNPNHPFILKLLSITYRELQDWNAIIELLPMLKKYNAFTENSFTKLESLSIYSQLEKQAEKGELESLEDLWLKLPSASRKNPDYILCYVGHLLKLEQNDKAEKLLKPLFKKDPSNEVLKLYGEVKSTQASKQFSFLEGWLNAHPQAPNAIYFALGKVAYNLSLWGKARFYFERSLRVEPSAEVYFMMAKTYQKLEDEELAAQCYQQGLEFTVDPQHRLPTLMLERESDEPANANLIPKFESTKANPALSDQS